MAPLWWQEGEHVLQDAVGQLAGSLAQQLGLGEGGPAPLQRTLPSHVRLSQEDNVRVM